MIRALIVCALCFACGGAPEPTPPPKPDLPDGAGVYRMRFNPPPCMADRPTLHAEIETPMGWERVALEGDESGEIVDELIADFGANPDGEHQVEGSLTGRVVRWSGGHVSRVLVVRVVDPPSDPDEAPDEESPTTE